MILKILIIDEYTLFREGLSQILTKNINNLHVFEAENCIQAEQFFSEHLDIDIILLDLNMSYEDKCNLLNSFTHKYSACPVVILSDLINEDVIKQAFKAGAVGYIPKNTPTAIMLNILELIQSGGTYMPPVMIQEKDDNKIGNKKYELTPRQEQVLFYLGLGYSNKNIANQLNIAEPTVKMHLTSIYKSLGVKNRTQAATHANEFKIHI